MPYEEPSASEETSNFFKEVGSFILIGLGWIFLISILYPLALFEDIYYAFKKGK